jgi:hypothetical protein
MKLLASKQESKEENGTCLRSFTIHSSFLHHKITLNAVSFACSSRAAAKITAKNANLKKTRASYYSGATADAELPFRISAKRAFHNGRPINGD